MVEFGQNTVYVAQRLKFGNAIKVKLENYIFATAGLKHNKSMSWRYGRNGEKLFIVTLKL